MGPCLNFFCFVLESRMIVPLESEGPGADQSRGDEDAAGREKKNFKFFYLWMN